MYTTIDDARTTLINSGLFEAFDLDATPLDDLVEEMYRHNLTVELLAVKRGVIPGLLRKCRQRSLRDTAK